MGNLVKNATKKKNVKKGPPEFKVGQKKKCVASILCKRKKEGNPPNIKKKNLSISVGPSILITNLHLYVLRSILHNSVNCILSLCFARKYIIKGDKICLSYCIRLH